jgi:hypothetical protein
MYSFEGGLSHIYDCRLQSLRLTAVFLMGVPLKDARHGSLDSAKALKNQSFGTISRKEVLFKGEF